MTLFPRSIADSKSPPEFEVENQGEVWILGTKGDAKLPAEALAAAPAVQPAPPPPPKGSGCCTLS